MLEDKEITRAHFLAQYAKNINSYAIWIEENPPLIKLALIQDVLFLEK